TKDKINSKKNQIANLESERKALESKIAQLKKDQKNILAYIELLDVELNGISDKLIGLEDEKVVLEGDIATTEENLASAEDTEASQYESMKLRIKYMYENGNENFLDLLLSSENMEDFLNKAEYVEKIAEYDRNMLDLYAKTREDIAAYKEQLLDEKTELELLIELTEAEYANMELLIASKEEELNKYDANIADNEALQEELDAEWDDMNSDLKALEEQLKKEEEEAKKKKVIYDGGQFIWPLKNNFKVTSNYGYRTHPVTGKKYSFHNGIDIGASSGTPILSAYKGVVATVAYTSLAGNYIMINHGSGLYTVYMHCSKIIAKQGQTVKQGDTIALVGSTGRSTAPHLHFSVRLNGEYVNPGPYIGYNK
ncbi:MAG: peptidoglycan DD-metalloendopeptidase family protein, partial [Lachnospiraceae bacterium]|nr:peptidoglycan DD-metalloendopeptidase family protein [Lachnospiraceae bacterium]